jgi:hydroxymethylpyrimidine pyrophosphatase-like HAD family hydrolase
MTFPLKNKGIIALDLDGTVTEGKNPPSKAMADGLNQFHLDGWQIAFITGRSLNWVRSLLAGLPFPYFLAVQNGAYGLTFPEGSPCFKRYISGDYAAEVAPLRIPLARYSGDTNDTVYWEPETYTPFMQSYLERRIAAYGEEWVASSFQPAEVAALKAFGTESEMEAAAVFLRSRGFQCTPIRDPFDPLVFIAQATHPLASKGEALKFFKRKVPGRVIAAGDDLNDISLLQEADVAIAMPQAPEILKQHATLIAQEGLLSALKEATQ